MERVRAASLTLLRPGRLRAMLEAGGFSPRLPWQEADAVAVWGRTATAARGLRMAERAGLPLITFEDAPLRSLRPGGWPVFGFVADRRGIHFDARAPSDLECILEAAPALSRAGRDLRALIAHHRLSKYNLWSAQAAPEGPYVLLADQRPGDASIAGGLADRDSFARMLEAALDENPGMPVLIRGHPAAGQGHFDGPLPDRVVRADPAICPHAMLNGAYRVYAVTSQIGFEAIVAGHRPRVFGLPFYAGWGLSDDEMTLPRRRARLTAESLFEGVMLRYARWYDPHRGRMAAPEDVIAALAALKSAASKTQGPMRLEGIRRWKRGQSRRILGAGGAPLRFGGAPRTGEDVVRWGSGAGPADARMEDGFLRSRGLGARLVPPVSLALDRSGIYYDPTEPSDLERLIAASVLLPGPALLRAERLRARLVATGMGKYNLPRVGAAPGPRAVLVTGQVEDDASLRLGAGPVRGNLALLQRARASRPGAHIVYRPHPDVTAGLRPGMIDTAGLADEVIAQGDIAELWPRVDEVITMTSLAGFEALLRGIPVTCHGAPFYAGWGLTEDMWTEPFAERRVARPGLAGLVHAALIDYPLYLDPRSGLHCPPEVIVDRLNGVDTGGPRPALLLLSYLQDRLKRHARLWR